MRRLMLLRHAKSDWSGGQRDHDRALAPRGKRAAPLIGAYMAQHDLVPDRVLVSTAKRAKETWALVKDTWRASPPMDLDERIYEATAKQLLEVVRQAGADIRSLLMIGHNPGFEELAQLLTDSRSKEPRRRLTEKFPTAALAVIDLPIEHWDAVAPHAGSLERFITPGELGDAD